MNTNHMTTIQHLMSVHCYGSISNKSTRPEENTAQEKYLTRLPGYNSTDQPGADPGGPWGPGPPDHQT